MSILNNSLLLGADAGGGGGGYTISRSLRFNSADSAYLSRTPASAGNRKTWTWAGWVKRSKLGDNLALFGRQQSDNTNTLDIRFGPGDTLRLADWNTYLLETSQVFRDTSAWYHIVVALDTTQATANNRARMYVNGVEITQFSTRTNPTQNADLAINSTTLHHLGATVSSGSVFYPFSGYLADIHFIDGQALDPTSFGEFDDNGIWQPKAYSGTYGTNGFKLDFADNSSNTATTLGKDTSPNGNNWTPVNLSVDGVVRNYASDVTTVATSIYNGTPASMFDGSISTYYGVTSNNGINNSISINLTGKGVSASTTIRVYSTFRNGMVWQINGSTVSSSGVSHPNTGWQTLSGWSAGAITSISTSVPSGSANEIYAIEIDGSILINNTGAGNDSLVDVPTNGAETDTGAGGEVRGNYATLNPLDKASGPTLANGNLDATGTFGCVRGTMYMPSGKWYFEGTLTATGNTGNNTPRFGVANAVEPVSTSDGGSSNNVAMLLCSPNATFGGQAIRNGSPSGTANPFAAGDVGMVAYDADNGYIWFGKNGTWNSGNPATGASPLFTGLTAPYAPFVETDGAGLFVNFGQRPFAYTAPSGFKALCTANLPTPTITKGSSLMDVVTYTGTGSTLTPTSSLGFSPDLVWIKGRSGATDNTLYDTVRGVEKRLESNNGDTEVGSDGGLTAFNSAGFTLGTLAQVNTNTATYAAWCWDAGSSTVTNTAGTIQSTVRANASAGFSIVTYTGNGTNNATVGHGLGVAPRFLIGMDRTGGNWQVWGADMNNGSFDCIMNLNTTAALATGITTRFRAASSTTFTIGTDADINASGNAYVTYCFAPVAGYSAFGSYTGNGSADGPFVYTGFRPRWVMTKKASATSFLAAWTIWDTSRIGYNPDNNVLYASGADAEITNPYFDVLSNGFKIRFTDNYNNENAATYIYAAFAENPFSISRAR